MIKNIRVVFSRWHCWEHVHARAFWTNILILPFLKNKSWRTWMTVQTL